jgi:hypothetical protein
MSVDPHYWAQLRYHTLVDEQAPFVLYALEVHSPYSKNIATKLYNHFATLHAQLSSQYRDQTVTNSKGQDVSLRTALPELPQSIEGGFLKSGLPSQAQIAGQK